MEILRKLESKAIGIAAACGLGVLALAGCGESKATTPATAVTASTILGVPETVDVHPGQTVVLSPAHDSQMRDALVNGLPLVSHIYPHGMTDRNAPVLGSEPVRLNAQVTMDGRYPQFDDDLACDVVNLDLGQFPNRSKVYIGALALSENDQAQAMVAWPNGADGQVANVLYLCFPDSNAPSDDGVVLVASDQSR
ncbi:MAG TPA: hypothetical protein VLF69_04640 [Candidatus Saccharimonadales bacterium]|nr:hypothetical protein [Candidatus Saccharimonadales bacterium]